MREEVFRIVSSWLAYVEVCDIAQPAPTHQEALRAHFEELIRQTWRELEGVVLDKESSNFLHAWTNLLLEIVRMDGAWWSFQLLCEKLKDKPTLRAMLPQLLFLEPAPSNALYWARKLKLKEGGQRHGTRP